MEGVCEDPMPGFSITQFPKTPDEIFQPPICKRGCPVRNLKDIRNEEFSLGSMVFECSDFPAIWNIIAHKMSETTIGSLMKLNHEVHNVRISKKKCFHSFYSLIVTSFLNPDFAAQISQANLTLILESKILSPDHTVFVDHPFRDCTIERWLDTFCSLQTIALEIKQKNSKANMEIYMSCVREIAKHPLWIQSLVEESVNLRCGPLKNLATRVTIENINWLLSKLKLTSSINFLHQLFCSPSVTGKCVALFQLLEIHDVLWHSFDLGKLEALIPTIYSIIEWLFDKCKILKDKTIAGFKWTAAKFRREVNEEDKFPQVKSSLPDTPDDVVVQSVDDSGTETYFVPVDSFVESIIDDPVIAQDAGSTDNNCFFDALGSVTTLDPVALRHAARDYLVKCLESVIADFVLNGFTEADAKKNVNELLVALDKGEMLTADALILAEKVLHRPIVCMTELDGVVIAYISATAPPGKPVYISNVGYHWTATIKQVGIKYFTVCGGVMDEPDLWKDIEKDTIPEDSVPITVMSPESTEEFVQNLEKTETGRSFLEWLKSATTDVYQFFKNHAIIGGALAFVFSIVSSLGITISEFKTYGDKRSFWKNLSGAGKDFYYLSRGQDTVTKVFKDFGDIFREMMDIDETPEITGFKQALLDAAERAEQINLICSSCPEKIANDPQKLVQMKQEMDNVRARYNELIKFNSTVNLSSLQPVWLRITTAYAALQTNYTKFCNRCERRKSPVCIWFWGRSCIGKSDFIQKFVNELNMKQGTKWEIFTVSKGPDYLNGFQQQKIILIDDFDSFSMVEGCLDALLIMNMVTTAPYNPNLADLSEKNLQARPELIIISSNFQTAKLNCGINDMLAFERRRDFLINVTWPKHASCDIVDRQCEHWKEVRERNKAIGAQTFDHLTLTKNHPLVYANAQLFNKPPTVQPKNKAVETISNSKIIVSGDTSMEALIIETMELNKLYTENYEMQMAELEKVRLNALSVAAKAVATPESDEVIGSSTVDWKSCPNVLLCGSPGIGKTTILRRVATRPNTKHLLTLDEFDQGAMNNWVYPGFDMVLFDDFTTFTHSKNASKFWSQWKARADVREERIATWFLGLNEQVAIKHFDTLEEYEVHTRADRCRKYQFSFRPKSKNLLQWVLPTTFYGPDDVNESSADKPFDSFVRIFDVKENVAIMSEQLIKTYQDWSPTLREKISQLRLPTVYHLDKIDAISTIPITSQEFIAMVNTRGSMYKTMSLLTDCDFKSTTFSAVSIGKRIYSTFTKMVTYHSSNFTDMDTFIMCGANSGFFDEFGDGNFVLRFSDRSYCLYPSGGRVIAGVYEPLNIQKDLGDLAGVIAKSINSFDFMKVTASTFPPWVSLAFGMLETVFKVTLTGYCIPQVIKQNKNMFKAMTVHEDLMMSTETYFDDSLQGITGEHKTLLLQTPRVIETGGPDDNVKNKKRNRFNRIRARKGTAKRLNQVSVQAASHNELKEVILDDVEEMLDKCKDEKVVSELATDDAVYDIISTICKNLVEIVHAGTKKHVVSGLMLYGKYGTTVGHLGYDKEDLSQYLVRDVRGEYHTMKFVSRDTFNDRLDFTVDTNAQFPDILKHIGKSESEYYKGKLVVMVGIEFIKNLPTLRMRFFRVSSLQNVELTGLYATSAWAYSGGLSGFNSELPPQTVKGDCGSVVLICDASRTSKIIGMHIASSTTQGFFRNLTSSMYPRTASAECCPIVGPLEEFQPPRYPKKEGYNVIAKCVQSPFTPNKTKLYRSPFAYGDCIYEPSVLCKKDPRAPDIEDMVYKESLKWLQEPVKFSKKDIETIFDRFAVLGDYLGQKLHAHGINTSVLNKRSALNTVRGYTHSKPIPIGTSAGYPFNQLVQGGKSNLISVSGKDGTRYFTDDQVLFDNLHLSIDHILHRAKKGQKAEVAFQVFPKDELLKKEKLKTKTRTIAAAPFPLVISLRMYFHTVYAALAELWDVLPVKVGIAPNSLDWTVLTQRLLRIGSKGFSIDQTDFDFNVPRELSEGVVHCMNAIILWTDENDTPENQYLRRALHYNVSEFNIIVNGLVYETTKGVPSGHPGTATENSLISLFCLFDAFVELAPSWMNSSVEVFFDVICPAVYGDDAMCSVHDSITSWYNLQSVANFLTNKYGMVITTADKSALNYTVKPILEMQFISRSFVQFGKYFLGPLEMSRLTKPLHFCHGNKSHHYYLEPDAITDDLTTALDAAHSALDEMFFHGEKKYEGLRVFLAKKAREIGLTDAYFSTYSEKHRQFFDSSEREVKGLYAYQFPVEGVVTAKIVQTQGWFRYKSRRCLLLGADYHWDSKSKGKVVPLPLFAANILRRINETLQTDFNQILVNEYSPPEGSIDWHKDDEKGLDLSQGVASLTICGDGLMQWCNASQSLVSTLECSPGFLYHMCGDYVQNYRHRRINHSKYTITMTFRKINSSL